MRKQPTQHQKIITLCSDGEYHCQNEFRDLFIFSPHKRRSEIEKKGRYKFKTRDCVHGVKGQFDYIMVDNDPPVITGHVNINGKIIPIYSK